MLVRESWTGTQQMDRVAGVLDRVWTENFGVQEVKDEGFFTVCKSW